MFCMIPVLLFSGDPVTYVVADCTVRAGSLRIDPRPGQAQGPAPTKRVGSPVGRASCPPTGGDACPTNPAGPVTDGGQGRPSHEEDGQGRPSHEEDGQGRPSHGPALPIQRELPCIRHRTSAMQCGDGM
jgi:hypothetical protein